MDQPTTREKKGTASTCRMLFCDWDLKSDEFDQSSLFDGVDLCQYDILFFDPLNFALKNGFRENKSDIRIAEYIPHNENDFLYYLSRVKTAMDQVRNFIDKGGIWVIRCNFPNSHINVRKKSMAGSGQYTESVISVFFWLEEFLGKYSLQYTVEKSLQFASEANPFSYAFKNALADSIQTQNSISKGRIEVIGETSRPPHFPAITQVSYGPDQGQIYLIPKFLVPDELERLIEVFSAIFEEHSHGPYKPEWLKEFEEQLNFASPYSRALEHCDMEMKRLTHHRQEMLQKQKEVQAFTDLLYKAGIDLKRAVNKALDFLGFYFPDPPSSVTKARFDFYLRDRTVHNIVGLVVTTREAPVASGELTALQDKINQCTLGDAPKGILVANSMLNLPPEQRDTWFASDTAEASKPAEICLLSTFQLFRIVCYLLEKIDSSNLDNIKASLRKDILTCVGAFELNDRKYYGIMK